MDDGESWIGPTWAIKDIRLEKDPDKEDCYVFKANIMAGNEEEAEQLRAYFEAMVRAAVSRLGIPGGKE